jgi:hypothetical protein
MDCLRESENHAEGVRACVHRDECMRMYVSACVCTVFLKKGMSRGNAKKKIPKKMPKKAKP